MSLEFKAKLYYGEDGRSKQVDVYYAKNMPKGKKDICVNIDDNGQVVISTARLIAMLKQAGRI